MAHIRVLDAADIPAAGTSVLTDPVISGLANVGHITAQFTFDYGSGGTSVTAWLQTSLDGGVTWIDIACAKFTTADAVKVFAVNAGGSLAAAFVPTDGALADDTVQDGLIGSLLRVKATVVGTYADSTLSVNVETRAGVGGAGSLVIADGADATLGAKADALAKTGSVSVVSLLKWLTAAVQNEDDPHVSGDKGLAIWGVRNDANGTFGDSGDYGPIRIGARGTVVVGTEWVSVADGSVVAPSAQVGHSLGLAIPSVVPMNHNGSSSDLQRNNLSATGLASAARTATTNVDITTYNARGIMLLLNVTANPGGGETLSLKLRAKESVAGGYLDIADAGVLFTAANGLKGLVVMPGTVAADLVSGLTGKSAPIARTVNAIVTHSSTGGWTYSLSYVLLV